MSLPPSTEFLARLGRGESITSLCAALGWSRAEFDQRWKAECARRVPPASGSTHISGCRRPVQIIRDARGVPHIRAENDRELFFGYGYAVAQDRLFQLDYMRRKAHGRLAEILGAEALESDRLYRTLDLTGIAARELVSLPDDVRELVESYAAGIDACLQASRDCLPIEFALLDYQPERWTAEDCLAIVGEFRWYLTGRFPVIVVPELVKRAVGEGPAYEAFLGAEMDDECILPDGSYAPMPAGACGMSAMSAGGEGAGGSNNWVLAASRTTTGRPMLASDPHVPFQAISLWHEAHLSGGSYNVAGVALAGMPAIMIGRNERVAWGVTNNISSLRDLYRERIGPENPDRVAFQSEWFPIQKRTTEIKVRGAAAVNLVVRSTHNGPLVDELLPAPARHTGPVSLRWRGFQDCGWVTSLIRANRAATCDEFRTALEPWAAPTFNVVMADVDGRIGYQSTGKIPRRLRRERAYRLGWEASDQWDGDVPWEQMPRLADPPQQFVVTANNRICPDDYPQPLAGTWASGYRARRIREAIESGTVRTSDEHRQLQLDVHSGRAQQCVPRLLKLLHDEADPRLRDALTRLGDWNHHMEADSAPAAIFHLFITHWCRIVTAVHLPADQVELVAPAAGPLALELLDGDRTGWLEGRERQTLAREALRAALDELVARLGPEPTGWQWGRLHRLVQKHPLSARGDLGELLDHAQLPIRGDTHSINSSAADADHGAWLGASYRLIADLADERAGLWSVDSGGVSGAPGSAHYSDQIETWHAGQLYYLPLTGPIDGPTLELLPAND